ncbi:hypothetical protein BDV26DRAFT_140606 [Aspergillus bertholletiae]|uniref:Uncharacterized protein n=1 Tax=Aspergillus bertholletiae TaxID=1226010 RepID=A0A5N7BF54_9EURO|nr:hypothetical protein BDV26DRAFT_140606 [Aspergillus bertholletiae]
MFGCVYFFSFSSHACMASHGPSRYGFRNPTRRYALQRLIGPSLEKRLLILAAVGKFSGSRRSISKPYYRPFPPAYIHCACSICGCYYIGTPNGRGNRKPSPPSIRRRHFCHPANNPLCSDCSVGL